MSPLLVRPTGHRAGPVVSVRPGPCLLLGVEGGPSLVAHRRRHSRPPALDAAALTDLAHQVGIRGRGGAGFPFATKLDAAARARGRATVVVNLSEGEPASFKDAVLALLAPHLLLDGAAVTARALGSRTAHVVVPGDLPAVGDSIRRALADRHLEDGHLRWRVHTASPRFVAGQARAVIELLSGRENLPVTAWQPEAVRGYHGRPTLLANAETHAQVAALVSLGPDRYAALGLETEPGTHLLTMDGDTEHPQVLEVVTGTDWTDVLAESARQRPVLVGGYHGTWARPETLAATSVSRPEMAEAGLTLGAGVVLPLADGECPLHRTAHITEYLASQSARRCGPCLNGLPALAREVWEIHDGTANSERAEQLIRLVTHRGACAHPDGTARLVSSMLSTWWSEVRLHATGRCSFREMDLAASASAGARVVR